MTGPSDATLALTKVVWPDAELLRIEIDYEDVKLHVREPTGQVRRVICQGYLGYELSGFWDEVVIVSAEVSNRGSYLDHCLDSIAKRLGISPLPTGSDIRNNGQPMQLILTLSDGCQLNVAMKGLLLTDETGED